MKNKLPLNSKSLIAFLFFLTISYNSKLFGFITITTTQTWNEQSDLISGFADGIRLSSGVLTLDGVILDMNPGSTIEVNNGAVLIINYSIIRSSDQGNDETWNGIVSSNAFAPELFSQFEFESHFPEPDVFDDEDAWTGDIQLPTDQINPVVIIKNGSIIMDALIAVDANFGMIVQARNSKFSDNAQGIKISNYSDPHHGALGAQVNASFIMDCIFEWTKENPNFSLNNLVHINLNKVRGVRIGGCTFRNNISTANHFCPDERGIGIKAVDATFALSVSGNSFCGDNSSYTCTNNCYTNPNPYPTNSQRNQFNKLFKGISIIDNGDFEFPVRGLLLRNSDFSNNFVGIDIVGSDFFKIIDCEFDGNRNEIDNLMANEACFTSSTLITDINIDMGIEYEIYDNNFNYNGDHITHINLIGMSWNWITSKIQKNTFTNEDPMTVAASNVTGVDANFQNFQLEFKCNTFNNLGTDISVGGSNLIKSTQGSSILGAGNQFSDQLTGRFRLNNSSGTVIDYHLQTLASRYDPLTQGFSQAQMGLNRITLNSPFTEPENDACKIACSAFRSNIQTLENSKLSEITAYPQPAEGYVNFYSNKMLSFNRYFIYDINGKVVETNEIVDISDNVIKISTSEFKSGLYLIQFVDDNNNIISKKFIIQN